MDSIVPAGNLMLKRVYAPPVADDGIRVLVDRLWPRGLSKGRAAVDVWLKNVAPSTGLRIWFDHDPARWQAFRTNYTDELTRNGTELEPLLDLARHGPVTLLFGAIDDVHNHAVVLRAFLLRPDDGAV